MSDERYENLAINHHPTKLTFTDSDNNEMAYFSQIEIV